MANISISTFNATNGIVSRASFGANVLFYYQNVGDTQDHHVVDEIVDAANIQLLRYPGGTITETQFDITRPNRTFLDANGNGLQDPSEKTLLAQDAFLEYCGGSGIAASIVLQSSSAPVTVSGPTTGDSWQATIDPTWLATFSAYVRATLEEAHDVGADIRVFEVGNEFYGTTFDVEYTNGATSVAKPKIYGSIANEMIKATQAAINEFKQEHGLGLAWNEPDIAIQAVAPNSHLLPEVNELWSVSAVQDQLDAPAIAALDAVLGHYYFYPGQSYSEIDDDIDFAKTLMGSWNTNLGKDFDWFFTEWNVAPENVATRGLKQLTPVLSVFSRLHEIGSSMLSFWPMEHHQTSLGAWTSTDGFRLNMAGQFFEFLSEELSGATVYDVEAQSSTYDVFAFEIDGTMKVMVASITGQEQSLGLGDILGIGAISNVVRIGSTGSPERAEEDLLVTTLENTGATSQITIGGHEILMFEIALNQVGGNSNEFMVGGSGANWLFGGGGNDSIDAGRGDNVVSGDDGHDTLSAMDGRDVFLGGPGNDLIRAGSGTNLSFGGSGDDTILHQAGRNVAYGNEGSDVIVGGIQSDILFGGNGTDFLSGDPHGSRLFGSDLLIGGKGSDLLSGGRGSDTFLFRPGDGEDVIGKVASLSPASFRSSDFSGISSRATVDFDIGLDKVQLIGFSNLSTTNVLSHLSDTGDGALFSHQGTTILFAGIAKKALTTSDFWFGSGYDAGDPYVHDISTGSGWDYLSGTSAPDEFIFGPDTDGRTRWNETITDFSIYGGDRLLLRDTDARALGDLSFQEASVGGVRGLALDYGNGSVFLHGLDQSDANLFIQNAIDFL